MLDKNFHQTFTNVARINKVKRRIKKGKRGQKTFAIPIENRYHIRVIRDQGKGYKTDL